MLGAFCQGSVTPKQLFLNYNLSEYQCLNDSMAKSNMCESNHEHLQEFLPGGGNFLVVYVGF